MKIAILMAAVLALGTVLSAGLAVLPATVQDVQANPCAIENVGNPTEVLIVYENGECRIIGNIDID